MPELYLREDKTPDVRFYYYYSNSLKSPIKHLYRIDFHGIYSKALCRSQGNSQSHFAR